MLNRGTHEYQFNWVSTASPAESWRPRNESALKGVTVPAARGLHRVLSDADPQSARCQGGVCPTSTGFGARGSETWNSYHAPTAASNFLSHMSLIVQPAPRMMKAPTAKSDMYHIGVVTGR